MVLRRYIARGEDEAIDKDKERILGLIEALDDKRAEQINYTFKQMIKHFSSIFSKIIPGGKGDLILTSDETEEFDSDVQRTINAKGVEISVSFTGELFLYYVLS